MNGTRHSKITTSLKFTKSIVINEFFNKICDSLFTNTSGDYHSTLTKYSIFSVPDQTEPYSLQ